MDKQKLIETLSVQSVSGDDKLMVEFLTKELTEIGCEFYHNQEDGNIYVTKGEADPFPCIVAHMDTVHKIVEDLTVLRVGEKLTGFNRVRMEQTGIGGDDKVGIFIALDCLRSFDNIKAVFFCDEEVGCFGSYEADMDFFDDVGFVLQCDRNGNKDFIHNAGGTPLSSKQFKKAAHKIMKDYGYKFEHGMMTDVMALKESGLECSCANMSCGYYNPHSYREYVDMDDVENCLDMVKEMFTKMGGNYYRHQYTKPKQKDYYPMHQSYKPVAQSSFMKEHNEKISGRLSRSLWDADGDWDGYDYNGYKKGKETFDDAQYCDCCLERAKEVVYFSQYNMDICKKCIAEHEIYTSKIV